MYYRRRIRLLLLGILGSMLAASLLVGNCMGVHQSSEGGLPLSFPYAIEDTPLILLGVVGYEGAYVEAGDQEVVDVAALVVKNSSAQTIRQARITVDCAGETFLFDLFCLPPGESLMVLDSGGKIWIPRQVYSCSAQYSFGTTADSVVDVGQTEDGVLRISNRTDQPIHDIHIYHKNWSKEAGMFIGGIAYETHIGCLQPGQLLLLRPDHFAPGISQIVYITSQ